MISDVEFPGAGGLTLRGRFYMPDDLAAGPPAPAVLMSHGFSAVKEMGLPPFADRLCSAGIAVLLYDHRCLGASDGVPRQQINPWAQMRDMGLALGWLGDRTEIDASRLGIWGSSYSGGEVIVLAATDPRVRAVVANVPFAGLPDVDYATDRATSEEIVERIATELADGPLADGGNPDEAVGPLAVVEEEGVDMSPFLGQPESAQWFLAEGAGTTWRNHVTLQHAFGTEPPFDPGVCAAHVQAPLLMVVATDDRVADTAVAVAAHGRAPEPKHLVMIDGDHFAPYAGQALDIAARAATDWFLKYL